MLDKNKVSYDNDRGAWICWDGNEATAMEVKRHHPDDPVLIFNEVDKTYTQFFIEYENKKPHMKNGKLIYEPEVEKI